MRLALADQLIRAGECDVVRGGGMESMTKAPHLLPKSRSGYKYGNVTIIDHMAYDGLWDAFTDQAMGALTDTCNRGEQARQSRRSRCIRGTFTSARGGGYIEWCDGGGDR
jgi:acetyl-CoA C-acetyltransferase